MGYRSDVLSAIVFADEAHKVESLVKYKLHLSTEGGNDALGGSAECDFQESITHHTLQGHPVILLRGNNWKWYEHYPDVQAWEQMLTFMHQECDASTSFIRIGEESGDVQDECHESSREELTGFYAGDYFGVSIELRCDLPDASHVQEG